MLDREGRRSGLTARLQSQLDARNGPARGRAVLILAHLRLPQGTARLEPMLDDDDPDVRLVAVAGLPLAEDPDAVPALVRALSKRRLAPERVIERLGQPWAVESLLAQLRELDARGERRAAPRVGVARALGHAGDPRAEPAMIELLRRGSLEERISAARALGAVGGRRSRPELERALTDEAWPLRAQAAKALGAIGVKRAVPALEAVLDDPAREAFQLVEVERVPRAKLPSAPVRAVYASPLDDRLLVIDKVNGGKADSLNCGIRYAAYPLFCAIDSDTLLDPAALARLVWSFQAEPETVATGGIVRILNGSLLEDGRIKAVQTPENTLVNVQIVEYLRAFLAGRAGWSRVNMLLIISGAFGLFRRETVVEAGGYDTSTVGEDAELVVRLHRHCRDAKRRYKITFVADPICWTEAPAERDVLRRQRDRWQRGLRAWPTASSASRSAGSILPFAAVLFGLAFTYGLVLSFGALLIEGRAFARYPGWRDLRRLMVAAVVENFGYRQWLAIVRTKALWTVLRPETGWGEMTRVGFSEPVPAVAPGISSPVDG